MAIKSIISSGSKVEKFQGPILKVGAASTLKLTREALDQLGVTHGDYAFIADDDEDANVYYVAGSKEEKVGPFKGAKLGIVGDKEAVDTANAPQLQFSHNLLGKKMYESIAVMDVTEESFDHEGLTFFKMTVKQTREEATAEKKATEVSKQAKQDAAEDKALEAKAPKAEKAVRESAE